MIYLFVSIMLYPEKSVVAGYYRGTIAPLRECATVGEAVAFALTVNRKKPNIALCGPLTEAVA